jgi:O-antigen/teichoic acid export membrane protein
MNTAADSVLTPANADTVATPSLRSRALYASAWIIMPRPLSMAMQLARSVILTRLLFPEAFGLMALIGVVTQGLQMCSDVGIGPSIVKSRHGEELAFLQTAWTLQIIRGFALWLICCVLAWPASVFYHEPMLLALLPIGGLTLVIGSFSSTAWSTHDRAMKRGRMTIIAYAAELLNLVAMLLAALWLRSVWALIVGGLCGSLISLALGHAFLPGICHRLRWDKAAAHELVHFGKWVFISTLLTFFAMQLDRLMLGKLIPMSLLGVYSIALVLSNVPRELVQAIASLVLFPVLAEKLREDPARMHERFQRARGTLLRLGLLLCLGVVAVAPVFFHYLYDTRYEAASWIAQLLAVSAWVTVLNTTTGYSLLAFGDSKSMALGNLANALITVVGATTGFYLFGLPGFIIGYALGTAAGELVQGLKIRQHGVGVLWQDVVLSLLGLVVGGAYVAAAKWLSVFGEGRSAIIDTLVALCLWAILAICLLPAIMRELAPNLHLPLVGQVRRATGVA